MRTGADLKGADFGGYTTGWGHIHEQTVPNRSLVNRCRLRNVLNDGHRYDRGIARCCDAYL